MPLLLTHRGRWSSILRPGGKFTGTVLDTANSLPLGISWCGSCHLFRKHHLPSRPHDTGVLMCICKAQMRSFLRLALWFSSRGMSVNRVAGFLQTVFFLFVFTICRLFRKRLPKATHKYFLYLRIFKYKLYEHKNYILHISRTTLR